MIDDAKILEATRILRSKEALKANTAEAVERGAFGAPTLFLGDEMYFGNHTLEFVETALKG
jgi:2-hydroxychromene-2-carboxylate isomerase